MQSGNITQRFSHDAQGKVVAVNYNGTEHCYLRNAQGDIVKLIDNNKNTAVEYTYDGWENALLSRVSFFADGIGPEVLGNVSNNVLKQYRRVMKRSIISMGSR